MVGKYKVITLCGSAKFKEDFLREQQRLTLAGHIVLSMNFFDNLATEQLDNPNTIAMLKDMLKKKIDMSDEIFVINKGGYIGASTLDEIEYAKMTNKKVNYMENIE